MAQADGSGSRSRNGDPTAVAIAFWRLMLDGHPDDEEDEGFVEEGAWVSTGWVRRAISYFMDVGSRQAESTYLGKLERFGLIEWERGGRSRREKGRVRFIDDPEKPVPRWRSPQEIQARRSRGELGQDADEGLVEA